MASKSGSGHNRRRAAQSIASLTRIGGEDFECDPEGFGGTAFRVYGADGRPADLFVGQGRARMESTRPDSLEFD